MARSFGRVAKLSVLEPLQQLLARPAVAKTLTEVSAWQDQLPYQLLPLPGLSQQSFLLQQAEHRWVIRRQTSALAQLGCQRYKEFRILKQLSASQLAPKAIFYQRDWLLVEYLPGVALSASLWQQMIEQGVLADRLAYLHRQPCYGYPLDIKRLLVQHWQLTDKKRHSVRQLRYQRHLLQENLPKPLMIAPLHLDLHAGNIVQYQQHWHFIDWEYAADGDIGLELAFLYRANSWTIPLWHTFLADYAKNYPRLAWQVLQRQQWAWQAWVDYLILLWYEMRWQQTQQASYRLLADDWRKKLTL